MLLRRCLLALLVATVPLAAPSAALAAPGADEALPHATLAPRADAPRDGGPAAAATGQLGVTIRTLTVDPSTGRRTDGLAELARVDLYDPSTLELERSIQGSDGAVAGAVEAGTYVALLSNSDGDFDYDFFPELYDDRPALRPDLAQVVTITAGDTTTLEATLRQFYDDMFDTPFTENIFWLGNSGITRGCNADGSLFCPDRSVTRGQMAAFLSRAFDLPTPTSPTDFRDDDDSIFEGDIEKLAAAGITRGCNPPANDRFCPDSVVTREQMAAFLSRAFGLPTPSTPTDFRDDDDSQFEAEIEKLAGAGITRGCNPPTNDRFCPRAPVTRGQFAAFMDRAVNG